MAVEVEPARLCPLDTLLDTSQFKEKTIAKPEAAWKYETRF